MIFVYTWKSLHTFCSSTLSLKQKLLEESQLGYMPLSLNSTWIKTELKLISISLEATVNGVFHWNQRR